MTTDSKKTEKLLVLTKRLTEALNHDIAALERGRPREMRSHKPEVQQLLALYSREVHAFNNSSVNLPKEALDELMRVTGDFRRTLAAHNRILTRVKTCTEGMIRAIAEDVAKKRAAQRPYAPAAKAKPRGPGAIVYNSVV